MTRRPRIIFMGVLLLLLITAIPPARQLLQQQDRLDGDRRRLEVLLRENDRLEDRLQRLEDPDYLETVARDELGLVRPGEVSYVIVPGPEDPAAESPPPPPKPWYQKAWNWFKGLVIGAG